MSLTNGWNQIVYRLWSPVYDAVWGGFFRPGRRRALELLDLKPGEKVYLVGVGTGADLPYLPEGVDATGVDLSPEMLARADKNRSESRASVKLIHGDAQELVVTEGGFDAVVMNLVLSVVPNGRTCLRSGMRALRPGGRMVIFDKFQPDDSQPTSFRKLLNIFSALLGTDITRKFGEMYDKNTATVLFDEPSLLGGVYRIILLKKL